LTTETGEKTANQCRVAVYVLYNLCSAILVINSLSRHFGTVVGCSK